MLAHTETHAHAKIPEYAKVDEIPFDFQRRIMSVVVRTPEGKDRIISKGAPEAIFPRCTNFELDGQLYPMDHAHIDGLKKEYEQLSADGFRVLAIASKDIAPRGVVAGDATPYSKADECDLILNGYVAFLDPPKETATAAIKALQGHGVAVKVVTGDNDLVARKICKEVGLSTEFVLLGSDVEAMSDDQLADAAVRTTLFARVSPAHKQRIIKALQSRQHTVGFMGDGINDAPALRRGRRRDQRRYRRGYRQRVGGHDPAGKVPAGPGSGRRRRTQGLRQHPQVRPHGREQQLRQHVQRAGGERLRPLPADGPDPDPGQQPALRHQPDRHSDRRRRPRAGREAAPLGHQAAHALHRLHRPVLVDLRLHDVSS